MNENGTSRAPTGMVGFTMVWLGQIISVLASAMTGFAITVWAYEKTGSVTALTLANVFYLTPFLVISPIAGAMVDRYNRKLMMMVSDLGAVCATAGLLLLQAAGVLDIWHIFVANIFIGLAGAFQWPAYSAAISVMVPKSQYGRANGMMSLVDMGPGVLAPLLAGALFPVIGLTGIMLLDVLTFFFAIGALALVAIPNPPRSQEGDKAAGNLLSESVFGFRYILARRSLLGLQLTFFLGNLFSGFAFAVLPAMILARTGNNETSFGLVQSAGAIGGIVGGVAMSAWGGFKRRVNGVLFGWMLTGALMAVFGAGRDLTVWLPMIALASALGPIMNASNQAIWQSKVPPDLQGRVFSARRLIAWFAGPVTSLIAGPLSDLWLEPSMRAQSGLSDSFGWLVGIGPGAGMALLFVVSSLCAIVVGLVAYGLPAIRNAESLLPDHTAAPAQAPAAG